MKNNISRQIPSYVQAVLDRFAAAGRSAYPVGGSLRDLLLGRVPQDFDLTTDATPDETIEIFSDLRVIPTGLVHGTVTVLSDGNPIEITTHRTDGAYTDKRHPTSVSFTASLTEDLARRDFTVNAMAWSKEQDVIDPFGGKADLAARMIRAVGDPVCRFSEDALRILRAFRFAAQLDFDIEEGTAAAAKALREGLAAVSVERIFVELTKLLLGKAAAKGLSEMDKADCLPFVFFDTVPDLSVANRLDKLPENAPLRLAALLHKESEDKLAALCRRLHTSNAFLRALVSTVAAYREAPPTTPYEARRFVCTHHPHFDDGLLLREVLLGEDTAPARTLCAAVLRDRTAVEVRRLAVNGRELQDTLGIMPAATGKLLLLLQDSVWQEPARNKKQTLLALATKICKENTSFLTQSKGENK